MALKELIEKQNIASYVTSRNILHVLVFCFH